jgi:hypothetical protein
MGTAARPVNRGGGGNTGSRIPTWSLKSRTDHGNSYGTMRWIDWGRDYLLIGSRRGPATAWGGRSRRAKSGEKFRGAGARFVPGKWLTTYPRTGRTQLDTHREYGCTELVIPVRRLSTGSSLRACRWDSGWCSSARKVDLELRRSILIARGREWWLHGVCWSRRLDSARGAVATPAMLDRVRWEDVADASGPPVSETEAMRVGEGSLCHGSHPTPRACGRKMGCAVLKGNWAERRWIRPRWVWHPTLSFIYLFILGFLLSLLSFQIFISSLNSYLLWDSNLGQMPKFKYQHEPNLINLYIFILHYS